MTEFIADGKFMALRAEAQETNSLLRELLKEQRRTNDLLTGLQPTQPGVIDFNDPGSMTVAPDGSVTAKPKPVVPKRGR